MSDNRRTQLISAIQAAGLDGLVLNPSPSLVYLTGLHFHLMERPVVCLFHADGRIGLVLPELEQRKVEHLPYSLEAFPYGENPAEWGRTFQAALASLKLQSGRIGVEPRSLRLLEYGFVREAAPQAEFPDASEVVSSLRIYKDDGEVAAMRRAVAIAQDALRASLTGVRAGMSEAELAAELTVQLLRHGSQPELSFSPIVSGGPNAANPHAMPSDRRLQAGDLLVIDWGAAAGGYLSDLTRTFAIGEVDEECSRIHQLVQQANAAGRAAARPGVPASAVDQAARAVIEAAGYGPYFTHRTGHGLGMEGHEDPYIRGDNPQRLEPGMTFTIEPGIYLPGRNGVRIEDNMLITADGAESLSDMPRELQVLG